MPLALGLMSGTSADGVSGALVEFRGRSFRLLAFRNDRYPKPVAELIRRAAECPAPAVAQLNMLLGELFALTALRTLQQARVAPARVAVIGSHGQTIYHGPNDAIPCTLQIAEPAVIAERTGIPVAANFRMRDLAAGGQGAPLMPYFDERFFGGRAPTALQNIGGIANVTLVGRTVRPTAFDNGPGNCLLDAAMRRLTKGRATHDDGGRRAARGRVDWRALGKLSSLEYVHRPPPKSTGPELFNERLIEWAFGSPWTRRGDDVLATLTQFTALTIAESYHRWLPAYPRDVIVSGGGALNKTLMRALAGLLAPAHVLPSEAYGLPAQAKEPVAFAYFGLRTLQRRTNHLPSTTGASRARILGTLTPA